MARRYASERGRGVGMSETLAAAATLSELEVYFILAAAEFGNSSIRENTVVGYVALRRQLALPEEDEAGGSLMLLQVFVEPDCRSLGYATSALRVLLANVSVVAMSQTVPVMCRMLSRLGFTDGGSFVMDLGSDDLENPLPCTFYRWTPLTE
jgi:hypothetical protein